LCFSEIFTGSNIFWNSPRRVEVHLDPISLAIYFSLRGLFPSNSCSLIGSIPMISPFFSLTSYPPFWACLGISSLFMSESHLPNWRIRLPPFLTAVEAASLHTSLDFQTVVWMAKSSFPPTKRKAQASLLSPPPLAAQQGCPPPDATRDD